MLLKVMPLASVTTILGDPAVAKALDGEYDQILEDREALRHKILLTGEDLIHLPVNVPRLLWNAKQEYGIKPDSKTDLNPQYVVEEMAKMMS